MQVVRLRQGRRRYSILSGNRGKRFALLHLVGAPPDALVGRNRSDCSLEGFLGTRRQVQDKRGVVRRGGPS